MLHLTGRTDLIMLCMQLTPERGVIRRAFATGTVEVLGLFKQLSPSAPHPGWMIRVTTCNKGEHLLALVPDFHRRYLVRLNKVHWEYWDGVDTDPRFTLTSGDDPEQYGRLRDAALSD